MPFRYRSSDEDSGRWADFPFRPSDIVISTRSKSGTTWMQMICALLIFQTSEFPTRLADLSPWLDWLGLPRDEVVARLEVQTHRRIIKTHTPLDGIPLDPRATYIVVAREPLDAAVSAYHQNDNLDRARMRELTGQAPAPEPAPPPAPLRESLLAWIDLDLEPREYLDSLPGMLHHLGDAWTRRTEPNVVLVHYDDLASDLDGEMRRVAARLGIDVPDLLWPGLVEAATFEHMQSQAGALAPDPADILIDRGRFFRRGKSGSGREVLTQDEFADYEARAASLATPDLWAWLHRAADDGAH